MPVVIGDGVPPSWNSPNRLDVPTYEPCYEYAKCVDIQAGANEGQIIASMDCAVCERICILEYITIEEAMSASRIVLSAAFSNYSVLIVVMPFRKTKV